MGRPRSEHPATSRSSHILHNRWRSSAAPAPVGHGRRQAQLRWLALRWMSQRSVAPAPRWLDAYRSRSNRGRSIPRRGHLLPVRGPQPGSAVNPACHARDASFARLHAAPPRRTAAAREAASASLCAGWTAAIRPAAARRRAAAARRPCRPAARLHRKQRNPVARHGRRQQIARRPPASGCRAARRRRVRIGRRGLRLLERFSMPRSIAHATFAISSRMNSTSSSARPPIRGRASAAGRTGSTPVRPIGSWPGRRAIGQLAHRPVRPRQCAVADRAQQRAHAETVGHHQRVDRVSEPTGSVSGTTNQSLP